MVVKKEARIHHFTGSDCSLAAARTEREREGWRNTNPWAREGLPRSAMWVDGLGLCATHLRRRRRRRRRRRNIGLGFMVFFR